MAQDATMKEITPKPLVVRGEGMTQFVRRAPQWVKSAPIKYTDTTSINIIELPGNTLVTDVKVHVTTAFDASGTSAAATATITVPNEGDTKTVWDASTDGLQSTGFKLGTDNMALTPSSGGVVAVAFTPGTTTAGQMEVYIEYIELEEML